MSASFLRKTAGGAVVAALAALALGAAPAQATVLTPNPPPSCSASTFNPASDSCLGAFDGNLTGTAANRQNVIDTIVNQWGPGWKLVGDSSQVPSDPWFSNNPGTTSGTLTFKQAIIGPFIIGLKASTQFSLFHFNAVPGGVTSVDFNTAGVSVNVRDLPQALSHATLYVVPEPETYAALLAGLGILGFIARRRVQNLA